MKKRLIAFCMALCMIAVTVCSGTGISFFESAGRVHAEEDKYAGYVYFTTEKVTLGQGFVIAPEKVGFYEGDSLADIAERALGDKSGHTGPVDSSYYLTAVIDGGEPEGWKAEQIPEKIREAVTKDGGEISEREKEDRLTEFDYYKTAGWMFSLNNKGISASAGSYVYEKKASEDAYTYADGDVIRLQFSVYNYGADLNIWDKAWGSDPLIAFPDKDGLIRKVADYTYESDAPAYIAAMAVLEDWDATEAEVTEAYEKLVSYMDEKSGNPSEEDTTAEDTSEEASSEQNPSEELQEVPVSITMNDLSDSMRLTDRDGNKVETGEPEDKVYNLKLKPGEYVITGIGTDGTTVNGRIGITVTKDENQSFQIYTITAYCSNSGWTYGTDYQFDNLTVQSADGAERRHLEMGVHTTYPERKTFLVLKGDSYGFDFTPLGDRADSFAASHYSGTVTYNAMRSVRASEKRSLTVTIPYADTDNDHKNDYQLEVGTLSTYYVYQYLTAEDIQVTGDTEVYSYCAANGTTYFYRISNPLNPDAVTYGNFTGSLKEDTGVEVTKEDLYVDVAEGTDYDRDTVVRKMAVNAYDVADIYLNANEKGCLSLEAGETYTLYPLRNWLAIEGIGNSQVIEPDFHYTVIDTDGRISSDVVAVTENLTDTSSKHSAQIEAKAEGTAIILVTYDAMRNMKGYSAAASTDPTFFSAIWPENTGVIVVTVGKDGSIDTGMEMNPGVNIQPYYQTSTKESGDAVDAELDVFYYTGDSGAEYTFSPETGVTVRKAVPVISEDGLSYTGFTDSGVRMNRNGTVTVSGLMEGPNIIELSKGDKITYQIIRAKHLDYTLSASDPEGNPVEGEIMPGDTVTVTFDTVYHPANKVSGYYNFGAQIYYDSPEETKVTGASNQYLFAATEKAQQLTVTIPENYIRSKYTLTNGVIFCGGFGSPAGQHRTVTYEKGKPANFTAIPQVIYLGELPDVAIPVHQDENMISDTYAEVLEDTAAYIHDTIEDPSVNSVGGEWAVMALAGCGYENSDWYHRYYENVADTVLAADNNKLSSSKSTENTRVILALTAIGANPSDIYGYDLVAPLSDMNYVTKQGINGAVFALLALDADGFESGSSSQIPEETELRTSLITYILSKELENGGWALSNGDAAVDITAMAIQALAPYYQTNTDVKAAVDRALAVLSEAQQEDGSFICYDEINAESTAQVVIALCALGIDPEDDYDLIKNGNSAVDALLAFYDENLHAFCHTTKADQMATEQAACALAAYDRLLEGKTAFYDMTDRNPVYIRSIVNSVIELETDSCVCDDTEKKPAVTVREDGRLLKEGTDYTVEYRNNVHSGKASAVIKGCGSHNGEVTKTFQMTLQVPVLTGAIHEENGLKVCWEAVPGADGYLVYRKVPGKSYERIAEISSADITECTDEAVTGGNTYIYTVRAMGGSGLSDYDRADNAVLYMAKPSVDAANVQSGVKLTWNKVAGASGYAVYRKSVNGSYTRIATLSSPEALSYTDTNVSNHAVYIYTVRGLKGSMLGSYAQAGRSIRYVADPAVAAHNADQGIHVRWTQIAGADSYLLYRKAGNEKSWSRIASISDGNTTSYTDTKVSDGTKYIYTVRAVSGGTLSGYRAGFVECRLPKQTVGSVNSSGHSLLVTWAASSSVTGYQVQWDTNPAMVGPLTKSVKSKQVLRYSVNVTAGRTYYVRVRNYKTVDGVNYYGTWSNVKSIRIPKK